MAVTYISGEPVRPGDRVLYDGEPGYVEEVADPTSPDAGANWFVQEFGGGCMLVVKSMGRVFLSTKQIDERLELVGRADKG